MASWIYIFSQFTPEVLLFESLMIFVLCGAYAGFWVLRKRRLGVIRDAVPVGVVKNYLGELIADAEQLRKQLFGLLNSAGLQTEPALGATSSQNFSAHLSASLGAAGATVNDPAMIQKIALLEAKMAEQTRAMETLLGEKGRIEKELEAARAASQGISGEGGSQMDESQLQNFKDQIKQLEGRLAEYSVIEDDLASLKKLQQENAQLKASLEAAQKSGATKTAPAAAAAPAPAPAAKPAAAKQQEPETTPAAASPTPQAKPLPVKAKDVESEPVAEAPQQAAPPDVFESLVDQVEESIQAESSTLAAGNDKIEPNDADLVAEFEKMLNS